MKTSSSTNGQERRKKQRYLAHELSIKLSTAGLLGWSKAIEVKALDFNELGLAFESDKETPIGSKVQLSLHIEHLEIENIPAIIVRHHHLKGNNTDYRIAVIFELAVNSSLRDETTEAILLEIENLLIQNMSEPTQ